MNSKSPILFNTVLMTFRFSAYINLLDTLFNTFNTWHAHTGDITINLVYTVQLLNASTRVVICHSLVASV